ncbi:MAG: SDR family oxidoreductase, partial [Oscillospiraceae bacterium]|nr:SDR family oxidoreductase [Oscillospiraceae bacterium]
GGAGGIGRSVVKTLLESGAAVAIVDVKQEAIDQAVAELSPLGVVSGVCLNLADVDAIAPAVKEIVDAYGRIDVLVQCAGLMGGGPGLEVTQAQWDLALNINSRGLFFMMQQVVAQSMAEHGGSIVNFASMAGIRGMHIPMCSAWYSASKGAVVALSMQAAVEWAPLGVRVNCVCPGGVETPAMREMGIPAGATDPIPLKKLNQPEDVANCVAFLASDRAATITGQTIVVDGGASIVGY